MTSIQAIKDSLAAHAEEFCRHLFAEGEICRGRFYIGNLAGDRGKSLVVSLRGTRAGAWRDFESGDGGSNLHELLRRRREYGFSDALLEAAQWLSGNSVAVEESGKNNHGTKIKKSTRVSCGDLTNGTRNDFHVLSRHYEISTESLLLARIDQVLYFFNHPTNGRCWCVTDPERHVRQDRRLDGKPFIFADGSTAKARTIGDPSYPIGYTFGKPNIILCEGSSDLLAAYQLVCSEKFGSLFAPVAILGATNGINEAAMHFFAGKNVLFCPDYDRAGILAAIRWLDQTRCHIRSSKIFDFSGLKDATGGQIKDLRDFLRVDPEQWHDDYAIREPLATFLGTIAFSSLHSGSGGTEYMTTSDSLINEQTSLGENIPCH